jgi:hypothetical protein
MSDRDERGRLLPGHSSPGPGRPKRETETAILNAITSALSPAQITDAIQTALDLAIEQKSPRGIVAVLELAAGYGIGKPIARTETTQGDPISAALEEMRRIHMDAADRAQQVTASQ